MPDSTFNSTRHLYRLYGLAVESAPRLISAQPWPDGDAAPVVRITFGTADFFEQKAVGLRQDCEDWIRHVVLADGSIYIRVNEVFEAFMTADGRDVVCAPLGDVDERTFEANLTNFALSTSLTLQGEECLHATVVAVGDRAVGLLGPSGSGKSTLSAFLLARGATLVTDDMLRVTFAGDGILAHPGPHRLKLFEDSASRLLPDAARDGRFNRLSGKVMFEPGGVARRASSPVPLSALFWLGEPEPPEGGDEVAVRRLAGIEPVKVLTRSTMNRRHLAAERLARQLRFAERVARALPVHALVYRRDYALLERVIAVIDRVAGDRVAGG